MRVFAFEGQRYSGTAEKAGAEVAPPYDQINAALRDRLHAASPHHFSHLITPVAGSAGDAYQEAARLHAEWAGDGTIVTDPRPALYPYEIRLAGGGARLGLGHGQPAAQPVIVQALLALHLGFTHFGQALRCAKAAIGLAVGQQLLRVVEIDLLASGLVVGRKGAAHVRPLIPLQAQPAQRFDDLGLGFGRVAL